ncbi:hypothetical protein HUN41_00275 [Streptomyces phage Coruscant]|uniref:Gene product 88 domain-containing protein n=1 Tax=Streptomyces phage Coruscant TaxID=2739834 RepID=A0A7G4AVU9_9CAUD|nr:hypothetical protein PP454_gp009 [Streptomyces phage Coruscant]YP_010651598.1 hypothetical protein PP454_gp054 [Streptomyces phage Coruscant]QMP84139.1 hypothetical protein HUN41_00009 [Streptomyces phage Coruscant]QMP84363.1 hypothetical protein HUN41_00275 [Streptomyces phage Coruscant]
MSLKRTNDRKTTVRAGKAGEGHSSLLKNAFSLPSGKAYSCPGATSFCESVCYAGRIEKRFPKFLAVAMHNWNVLNDPNQDMLLNLMVMIEAFRGECEKFDAPKLFRWHADGDIFSKEYAQAIAICAREFTDVQFWIYTRSFEYVQYITGYDNMAVYLSIDDDNFQEGLKCYSDNPSVNIAWLGKTFDEARGLKYSLAGGKYASHCPENKGTIPLITEKGGACVSCGLCIFGKNNVSFSTSKK